MVKKGATSKKANTETEALKSQVNALERSLEEMRQRLPEPHAPGAHGGQNHQQAEGGGETPDLRPTASEPAARTQARSQGTRQRENARARAQPGGLPPLAPRRDGPATVFDRLAPNPLEPGDLRNRIPRREAEDSSATSRKSTASNVSREEFEELKRLLERKGDDEEMVVEGGNPFSDEVMAEPFPAKFKMSQLQPYSGTTDPVDHIEAFSS